MAPDFGQQPPPAPSPQTLNEILLQETHDDPNLLLDADLSGTIPSCRVPHFAHSVGLTVSGAATMRQALLNDVRLIRSRQIGCNQKLRRQMEILSEDRVSKNKLEEIHCSLPSSIKSTFIMTFSPDGRRVASTHGDHRIYICDLSSGRLIDTLEGHPKTPWCLAWHPNNANIFASGCLAGEVRVWDLNSKACELWTNDNHSIITSLDFHPQDRILVIATANDILFWDWSESEPFAKTSTMHEREKVKFVEFDTTGTKLITGISNLPKYTGCSSDSLQNRIIDGYLSQGTIDSLHAVNMTQNSETTPNQSIGTNIQNENTNRQYVGSTTSNRPAETGATIAINQDTSLSTDVNLNEQNTNYRNTILLSRVSYLYRHLETLEDSMRHTGFAPLLRLHQTEYVSTVQNPDHTSTLSSMAPPRDISDQAISGTDDYLSNPGMNNSNSLSSINRPPIHPSASQDISDTSELISAPQMPNTFEPYLVTFDESLVQIQLPALVIDGRQVDLVSVVDQYPVDLSQHLYHAMQFESVNQVNQNFIRISKLMCSARLYRQIVHQISTTNSGNYRYLPNQPLTAQSIPQRSSRNSPNLPIVLNFPIPTPEQGSLARSLRTNDPIMAIEFRNTARNVPLASICKIDLLAARTLCILRAQHLVEEASENTRPLLSQLSNRLNESGINSSAMRTEHSVQTLLGQLHSTLTTIIHAPLTTSNAYTHITSLRVVIDRLHKLLSSLLRSASEGKRLSELIHNVAFSLTNRRWSVPLGATFDEIRLDVIHTLCITDLTLHYVRQVQLLQMQRISVLARVDESRPHTQTQQPESVSSLTPTIDPNRANMPGTSNESQNHNKRKGKPIHNDPKRKKLSESSGSDFPVDFARETRQETPSRNANNLLDTSNQNLEYYEHGQNAERTVMWNGSHNSMDQSLQRFLIATTSTMTNSHILVRVYHRLHGSNSSTSQPNQMLETPSERTLPQVESRRRALSQDNNSITSDSSDGLSAGGPSARSRLRPPAVLQVNLLSSPQTNQAGAVYDPWQRQPHLHVYQTRGVGQHLWFNQWTIPFQMNNSNYRIQSWNFSRTSVPNIKDSQVGVVTHKCRIHNDSSVDISSDGAMLACLVPRDDSSSCFPGFDLKIFSINSRDFGTCYFKLPQGPNALSVSFSPSGNYAVVGLATLKSINYDQTDHDLTIGKVFKLDSGNSAQLVRDIKIKRDDSSTCLNSIKWMQRGIIYSVGPHLQRYQTAARMRNVAPS